MTDQLAVTDVLADDRLTTVGLFAEAFQGLATRLSAQVAEHGLSEVDFEVLIRLARSPEGALRMSDLSAQTSLTTSGVTRVVDRLAASGLVCRRACALDRRSTYAVVTEAGRERLAETLPGHLDLVERWLTGPLPAAELDAFVRTLRVLRDGVRPEATAGAGDMVEPVA
jgi:MarR family 2-MHQ and catechol resistance regulon transcriptional repressor